MSADEDTELRDLVAQTLESNGVLGKLKAQLRANVFMALEEQDSFKSTLSLQSTELRRFVATTEGRLITSLVREFLAHFNLDFTLAVFDPEISSDESLIKRNNLAKELDVQPVESEPLLSAVLRHETKEQGGRRKNEGITSQNKDTTSTSEGSARGKAATDGADKSHIPKPNTTVLSSGGKSQDKEDDISDNFFDDPIPKTGKSILTESDKTDIAPTGKGSKQPTSGSTGMTSLAGLPSLNTNTQKAAKTNDLDKDLRAADRKSADLGFEIAEDYDYDEDFESSNVSPMGPTPRSPRSDHNAKSLEEDIEEDIEEDLSVAEDLLKSDNSLMDDLTTDRTVSPTEQSAAFDYAEDIPQL